MTPALMTRLDGGVLTLTMNRPDKRNALNPEMMQALLDALRDAAGNAAVKVLVLTGAGDAFCAGGDVGAMASGNLFAASYEASVDILRQKMEAPRFFSYTWHPYPSEPSVDYSKETPTLVEFTLTEKGRGTLLTVVESGFDRIPAHRRDEAFRMNEGGWAEQMRNISAHVTASK